MSLVNKLAPVVNDVRVFDANGDIILEVGIERQKLRVNSATMSAQSDYFRVLFGPDFLEGQQVRGPNMPATVELKEDQAYDMVLLNCLIHFGRVPDIGPRTISSLIPVIDKYGLFNALSGHMGQKIKDWLNNYARFSNVSRLAKLIAAGWHFKDSVAFGQATKMFLMTTTASTIELYNQDHGELFPPFVFNELAERRSEIAEYIVRSVLWLDQSTHVCNLCKYGEHHFLKRAAEAFGVAMFPPLIGSGNQGSLNIEGLIAGVGRMEGISFYTERDCFIETCDNKIPVMFLRNIAKHARDMAGEMCMKCVEDGTIQFGTCPDGH